MLGQRGRLVRLIDAQLDFIVAASFVLHHFDVCRQRDSMVDRNAILDRTLNGHIRDHLAQLQELREILAI